MWAIPPILEPVPLTTLQRREERIARIIKAMQTAPSGFGMMEWIMQSEESQRRAYAKAIEPLLAAYEEEDHGTESD